MTTSRAIRASDLDREHVVEILRRQYSEGRLTLGEFDDRTGAAYTAKTWGDLLDLTGDLPVEVRLGGDHAPATASGEHGEPRRLPWPVLPAALLLLGALLVSAAVSGGMGYWHHGHHAGRFFPVLPLLVLAVASLRWIMRWRRGGLHR